MRLRALALALLLVGCASPQETTLLPLKVGQTWSYKVHGHELDQVVPFRVTRSLSVAGTSGYEIAGDLGTSRVAWLGTKLVADRLAGTNYDPPLPLLDSRVNAPPAEWEGSITTATGSTHSSATQSQALEKHPISGHRGVEVRSTVTIERGHSETVLVSWFDDGVGLVHQEERSGGVNSTSTTMTSGP